MLAKRIQSYKHFFFVIGAVLLTYFLVFHDRHLKECISFLNQLQYYSWPENLYYFSLLFLVTTLLFIPLGLPLNLFAGMLWGTIWGAVIVNTLSILIAGFTFLIAKIINYYLLNPYLNKIDSFNKFKKIFHRYDWKFIFIIRINPIVPFAISNYLLGFISELSFKRFMFVTTIANMLPCLTYASIGSIFRTFSLNDRNVHDASFNIIIAMLLLSLLLSLKWFLPKFNQSNV